MAATGKSKTGVWRWHERYMVEDFYGLLRDKTRPPGIASPETDLVEACGTVAEPSAREAAHRMLRTMANAVGIAASSVAKI